MVAIPVLVVVRFIPAGAGNTRSQSAKSSSTTVYPRWRGEHISGVAAVSRQRGLSPLARGTPSGYGEITVVVRFIPAGAGNTWLSWAIVAGIAVYPRWRGEHTLSALLRASRYGLSPLARGTRFHHCTDGHQCRFIPAGAGNTLPGAQQSAPAPVYPRWRGEHYSTSSTNSFTSGLSPLARGTPGNTISILEAERFIPAGAGNTATVTITSAMDAVYPRWRGEHRCAMVMSVNIYGLSPLARGTRFVLRSQAVNHRFIPAGAGNT